MVIYLDNNATTKVDKRVLDEMLPYLEDEYANPSSMYQFSVKSSKAIAQARAQLRDFFGAKSEREVIFTSCGSESANTAIKGVLAANKNKKHIITTKVEHPCVLNLYQTLEKQGYKVDYIGVHSDGSLDLEELKDKIDADTALVSVMWANNETGVLFPVEEIGEIIKSKNPETKFFVDAVQASGKVDFDLKNTNIDLLGVSGHKFHAPKGIGALYVKSNVIIPPLIVGGHQERGLRAGTENVPYIVGLGVAEVYNLASKGDFYELKIKVPDGFSQYYVKKGSITIDGISLTIADISNNIINVAVIPHTYEATNLSSLKKGDAVNIEFDILAKYVEKNLLMNDNKNNITMDFLEENGFV